MKIPLFFVVNFPVSQLHLALGMIQASIGHYKDGLLKKHYRPLPPLEVPVSRAIKIAQAFGPGVWLFSNYLWTIDRSLEISAAVKQCNPRNITIHGGPSTPKYPEANMTFMTDNLHVDFSVRGEGEITAAELLEKLIPYWENTNRSLDDFAAIKGISYLQNGLAVRTDERRRIENLDDLPSPYLTGVFDHQAEKIKAAISETNRGCPYRCAFCDWGSLTAQTIKLFDLQRVYDELEWIGKRQIPILWVADANFGIFKRDVEIAAWIATVKEQFGYPREIVVNFAKNATSRIAEIVKIFNSASITCQGIISIQTTDKKTLKTVNRSNIKTENYAELAKIFRAEGLPLSSDLMIGLPGSTIDSFKQDLQRFFDDDIPVKAYHTTVLPNSPMADPDYIEKYKIKVSEKGRILSTFSFNEDDLRMMINLYSLFVWCEKFAFIKYVLCYMQWEHGISALDYIDALLDQLAKHPSSLSMVDATQIKRSFEIPIKMDNGSWRAFYQEIADFTISRFSINPDSAFRTVFQFNEAVMPTPESHFPKIIHLDHDFEKYYKDHRKNGDWQKPLSEYLPGEIAINDPENISSKDYKEFSQYDSHQIFWELENPLRRAVSNPYFIGNKSSNDAESRN